MSIDQWIEQWSGTDRVAFEFEGQPVTYAQLEDRISRTANGLAAAGVEPGDRVGFCGLNRVELFDSLFACARLGAIFVPFNNRLTAAELRVQIDDCAPHLLLATDGFASLLSAASNRPVFVLDDDPFDGPAVDADGSSAAVGDADTVLMVYTSGTTGQAKGAMLSHHAMLHTVLNSIDHQQLTADDCIVAPLPTFHVGGLNIQTLPTLYMGGKVLLQRRFDPSHVLELIRNHRVTQTLLVPAMLHAVAGQPDFATTDLSSLRGINTGSSVVPADVMQPYFDRGVPVGQVYGTTETGPTAIVLDYKNAAERIGTCGRPAVHSQVRIVDPAGKDKGDDQPGEVWVRGANLFTGYWNDPAATASAFAADGWFRTGDIGFRDADGYITISDRMKDVVISGGENVYPAEIEPILLKHPAIAEIAVVGEADDRWGEVPVAVVALHAGATLTIDGLREWCQDRIARFKQPQVLRIVDSLPRTALGKVKKHELRP